MKKGLILLTSLLVAGTAIVPLVKQENKENNLLVTTQETIKSHDIVDLTMNHPSTSTRVALPNLLKLLKDQLTPGEYHLKTSAMSLTNKAGVKLGWWNTNFDTSTLPSIIGGASTIINRVTLSVSDTNPSSNYVYLYYQNAPDKKEDVKVIGRFDWRKHDMSSYWTTETKFEFELDY